MVSHMRKILFFFGFLANSLSYAGEFVVQIDAKIKSPIPEIAFYDDACAFFNDDFLNSTIDFTPARKKEVFVQLFARNFGFHIWVIHRKKLLEIASTLYQTILYEREKMERLTIANLDSSENISNEEEVYVQIIYDEE